MRRALLAVSSCVSLLCVGCSEELAEEGAGRTAFFKHGPPTATAPYPYLLTSYGAPDDTYSTGTPACGGKPVDGKWYYSTGAYTFGCHSKLRLEANGKCVVVEVVDNGPAAWVEAKAKGKCGGTGYIIDASPLVAEHLFGSKSAGWSDCFEIAVTPVDASTAAGPTSCGSKTPAPTPEPEPAPTPEPEPSPSPSPTPTPTPPTPTPEPTPTAYCGDGNVDVGEICDTGIPGGLPGSCPKSCDDGNPCTADMISGSGCQAICNHVVTCTEPT
jgi:hypothetical protein